MYSHNGQQYIETDFSGADLRDGEPRSCSFIRCRFRGTRLEESQTYGCGFIDCDFTGARAQCFGAYGVRVHQLPVYGGQSVRREIRGV
ncbi:pentapeptide repeat-containing protein [Paenibacillus sp. P25]|nr:pentapeptide repeat-containing protein [Paenibacillus sp. P25]